MTTTIPNPDDVCPVCPHQIKYHDGVGCTDEQAGNDGAPCPCPVSQSMPGRPLEPGIFAPKQ